MNQEAKNNLAISFNELARAAEIFREYGAGEENLRNFQNYVNLVVDMQCKKLAGFHYAVFILRKFGEIANAAVVNIGDSTIRIDDFINAIDYLKWQEWNIISGSMPEVIIANEYLRQMNAAEFYCQKND